MSTKSYVYSWVNTLQRFFICVASNLLSSDTTSRSDGYKYPFIHVTSHV